MYKALKLNLSEKQILQASKGKSIKVTNPQINSGSLFIWLHPENAKKVEKAFLKKTGTVLHLSHGELLQTASHHMEGSGFWSNIWHGVKSGWKALKDSGIASSIVDLATPALGTLTGQPGLVMAGRQLLRNTTGVGCGTKKMTKNDRYAQLKGAGIFLS